MSSTSQAKFDGNSVSFEKQRRIFKIIVIGDSSVGKTCLTFRFCGGNFPKSVEATIGVDFRERQVVIDGEPIRLQLWDTAGQEKFRSSMVAHYYRNLHAVIFVYDVTNMLSFQNLSHWIAEFKEHLGDCPDIPKILVGNKCDCKERVAVNTNMAQKFADSHNMPLFETSAKDDDETDHVNAIFMTLAHKLKSHKPMMQSSLSSSYNTQPSSAAVIRLERKDKTEQVNSSCCNC